MSMRRLAASLYSNLARSSHHPDSLTCSRSSSYSTSSSQQADSGGGVSKKSSSSFGRRAVPIVLLSLTGGVALSAVNDLAIFNGCSSKAIERASQNQQIIEALGEPIVRGPWYDASLAVGYRRNSVSCTFPVSGPLGSGIFQLKAIRQGDDSWFSFLRHNDWDILIMEALLHVPSNDQKHQTFRVSVTGNTPSPDSFADCRDCRIPASENAAK